MPPDAHVLPLSPRVVRDAGGGSRAHAYLVGVRIYPRPLTSTAGARWRARLVECTEIGEAARDPPLPLSGILMNTHKPASRHRGSKSLTQRARILLLCAHDHRRAGTRSAHPLPTSFHTPLPYSKANISKPRSALQTLHSESPTPHELRVGAVSSLLSPAWRACVRNHRSTKSSCAGLPALNELARLIDPASFTRRPQHRERQGGPVTCSASQA